MQHSRIRGYCIVPLKHLLVSRMHLLYKLKHAFVSVADKIVRRIGHGMLFVKELDDMKASDIYVKMNISSVFTRCMRLPHCL